MGWFSSKPQGCSTSSSKLQRLKDAIAPLHSQLRVGCICDAVPVPITAAKETPLRGRAQPFGFHSFFHFRSLLFTIPLKAARLRPFAAQGSKLQKGLQAAYVGLAPSCTGRFSCKLQGTAAIAPLAPLGWIHLRCRSRRLPLQEALQARKGASPPLVVSLFLFLHYHLLHYPTQSYSLLSDRLQAA